MHQAMQLICEIINGDNVYTKSTAAVLLPSFFFCFGLQPFSKVHPSFPNSGSAPACIYFIDLSFIYKVCFIATLCTYIDGRELPQYLNSILFYYQQSFFKHKKSVQLNQYLQYLCFYLPVLFACVFKVEQGCIY